MRVKTAVVKKHVGKMLAKYDFEYKRMRGEDWEFVKKNDESIQTVFICKRRYEDALFLELYFDCRKGGGYFRAEDLDVDVSDFDWKYSSEEDVERILEQICLIIEKYGIPAMESALEKVRDRYIYTDDMAKQVYYNHEKYANDFINENGIEADRYDDSAIDAWFKIINNVFEKMRNTGNRQEFDAELIKIASFIGGLVVKNLWGKWVLSYNENLNYQRCMIERKSSIYYPNIDILEDLEDVFNQTYIGNMEGLCKDYKEMFGKG